jgi:hypothetical protein
MAGPLEWALISNASNSQENTTPDNWESNRYPELLKTATVKLSQVENES